MADQETTTTANANQTDATPVASQSDNAAVQEVAQAFGVQVPQEVVADPEKQTTGQEQAGEQVASGELKGEPAPGSEEEHSFQSWVGRKLAETKKETQEIVQQTIQQTLAQFLSQNQGSQQRVSQPIVMPNGTIIPPGIDPDSIPTTAADILELVSRQKNAEIAQEKNYWTGYQSTLGTLANHYALNPDQVKEVQVEMDTLGHGKQHPDPRISAQLNFNAAMINVMKKAMKNPGKPDIPVSGKEPISATGIATSQKTDSAKTDTFSVDAETKRILGAFNLGDDFAQRVAKENKG